MHIWKRLPSHLLQQGWPGSRDQIIKGNGAIIWSWEGGNYCYYADVQRAVPVCLQSLEGFGMNIILTLTYLCVWNCSIVQNDESDIFTDLLNWWFLYFLCKGTIFCLDLQLHISGKKIKSYSIFDWQNSYHEWAGWLWWRGELHKSRGTDLNFMWLNWLAALWQQMMSVVWTKADLTVLELWSMLAKGGK